MLDFNDLYFFVQVVDHKGFTAASAALKVPKSNLSRRIQKLEQRLGVRLIHRSSRSFVVTELGEEFYKHCRAMTIEADEAHNVVRRRLGDPAGRVRLSCPVALGQHVVSDLLAGLGLAAIPAHVCRLELDAGSLRQVLSGWTADHATVSLLSPSRRGTLPAVKALADHLIAELPRALA